MLTKGDEYPLHQTPEPIAYAGTDRNFYDRYFFNGYSPDGSTFFGVAFGVYPHLNVADAHFTVIRDGTEYCLHASCELNMERLSLEVGPIRIDVIEPLKVLRVIVSGHDGISADITFTGRSFPIEEPRFVHRYGPRTFMDYTRMTQNGHYSGWIEVDGKREQLAEGTAGTRDRSWGIRPVGTSDAQPHPGGLVPAFFWQWTPLNFANRSMFFHINANTRGAAWNTRAVIVPDGAGPDEQIHIEDAEMAATLQPGTRWPSGGTLTLPTADGDLHVSFEPIGRFQMRGMGYTSPKWSHGLYHGPLEVEREDIDLAACEPGQPQNLHVQMICKVRIAETGEEGVGVFEQLVIGPYAPMGFKEMFDLAQ
ncbi:hypothetical protein RXV95_09425 [Novosphingobium sp. ZN18A2]|uniref:hypothetical protein n=1 Tax=Novosphingobium sp. ZN18A2 TaxID=3079861 RepID=UPI0030D49D90